MDMEDSGKIVGCGGCVVVAAIIIAIFMFSGVGFQSIPPGSVGVKFNGGSGVSKHLLRPEVEWVGYNEKLIIYPTNIQQATYVQNAREGDKPKDDSIQAATKEGAVLPVDVTVSYRIPGDSAHVKKIFDTFGVPSEDPEHPLHFIQKEFIRWATIVAVNDVSSRSSIFDLISKNRAQFGPDVKAKLGPQLQAWGLELQDVLIREIHPPQEIVDKINEQQQIRAELQRINIAKQQAVTDAQTAIIEAQKVAAQNNLLSQQGQQAVALKRLERRQTFIRKWDGHSGLVGAGPIPQF